MSDYELIQKLHIALCITTDAFNTCRSNDYHGNDSLIAEANNRLAQSEWVRVKDKLPLVHAKKDWVNVWIFHLGSEGDPLLCRYGHWETGFDTDDAPDFWRYAESTPTPPKIGNEI